MPAGAVSLIGLINPVVGTVLGVAVAGEAFGWVQATGMVLVLGGVVAGQPATIAGVRARAARTWARNRGTAEPVSSPDVEMCDAA
jgi:probable blue pigment (indigoidine) exporter